VDLCDCALLAGFTAALSRCLDGPAGASSAEIDTGTTRRIRGCRCPDSSRIPRKHRGFQRFRWWRPRIADSLGERKSALWSTSTQS